MDRRAFVLASLAAAVAARLAEAQPTGKMSRVGILATVDARQISGPTPSDPHVRALVQRLSELGWAFGHNLVTEPRGAAGRLDRLPALAEDLARVGVDVIVTTGGNPAALAAKRAAPTIPIVMATSGDPVGSGLVASLARPGSNITGISLNAGPEIYAKRLGLLKEAAARITRVGVISRKGGREQPWYTTLSAAAENTRISLVYATVAADADYPATFTDLVRHRVDGLFVSDTPLNFHNLSPLCTDVPPNTSIGFYGARTRPTSPSSSPRSSNSSSTSRPRRPSASRFRRRSCYAQIRSSSD